MQMTVDVDAKQVQTDLARLAGAVADMTPAMRGIGQQLETNIQQRFKTKADPAGKAWAPYKPISAVIHEAIHGKPPEGSLLDRSGNLRRGAAHHASADMVEVGLTAPYAKYHEFGTAGRRSPHGGGPYKPETKGIGPIPRRGMVFGAVAGVGAAAQVTRALSASDEADVMEIIQRHINNAINSQA
jgi:phage virion morphogenesis protein